MFRPLVKERISQTIFQKDLSIRGDKRKPLFTAIMSMKRQYRSASFRENITAALDQKTAKDYVHGYIETIFSFPFGRDFDRIKSACVERFF